ncbi:MAG: GNAT family N-acetyltransferase [Trueperaceae bacterium]|nr:MAG: GNAT family N-acetyltransferase [Trueperaceae bacterium]
MIFSTPHTLTRPATAADAELVHTLYHGTPGYFEIISIPIPTLSEVKTELATAVDDARRFTELVLLPPKLQFPWSSEALLDPLSGRPVAGYLDYKIDYPLSGDATVNLLLIHSAVQNMGVGRRCVLDLESRLRDKAKRVLASIYGQNTRAERFWRSLGYQFAIDAKPVLDWYAKSLT